MCRHRHSCCGSSPHTRGALSESRVSYTKVTDHPRIRGEHRPSKEVSSAGVRIIPAYAGSTGQTCQGQTNLRGSSPHTRGARRGHPRVVPPNRIIPAYAGSTVIGLSRHASNHGSSPHTRGALECRRQKVSRVWDHPRIRGEHYEEFAPALAELGIIPAYAGSTETPRVVEVI